jgi:hypothetical protein
MKGAVVMAKRQSYQPPSTIEEQRAQLKEIEAALEKCMDELRAVSRRRERLLERQRGVESQLVRDLLKGSIGQYVTLRAGRYDMFPTMRRLGPHAGAIGHLVKVGRTRAVVDFGEDVKTWFVHFHGLAPVNDPLAKIENPHDPDPLVDNLDLFLDAMAEAEERRELMPEDQSPWDDDEDLEDEAPDPDL